MGLLKVTAQAMNGGQLIGEIHVLWERPEVASILELVPDDEAPDVEADLALFEDVEDGLESFAKADISYTEE